MQAMNSVLPYLYTISGPPADRPVGARQAPLSALALLAGVLLLLSHSPEAGLVPQSEIIPLEDTQGDLTLAEIVERIEQHLPAGHKPQAYRLGKLVFELGERHQLSPALILAVIEMESSYRFAVKSKAGAIGLMQLLPGTAAEVAKRYHIRSYHSAEDLSDPSVNLRVGVAYLAQLRRQFGHSLHYLAAYNLGPTALRRRLNSGRYELGALEPYVRSIHERARLLR
ncbi:MAG TPA: transglycosylase SLT domain-containing protein, partial [Bdellovibrionota bacterium]